MSCRAARARWRPSSSFGRSLIRATAASIEFSPSSGIAPCAPRPWRWTIASTPPTSASPTANPVASSAIAKRGRRAIARAREPLPPRSSSTGKANATPSSSREEPAAARARAASRQATTPPLSSTDPSPATTSPSTTAAAGQGGSIVSTCAAITSSGSSPPTTRQSRPVSVGTRETGRPDSRQSSSIRSTIRPSEPDGEGMSTSSASSARAVATASPGAGSSALNRPP